MINERPPNEAEINRAMVDALREVLGLDPLYGAPRDRPLPLLLAATPTARGGFRWSDDGSGRAAPWRHGS